MTIDYGTGVSGRGGDGNGRSAVDPNADPTNAKKAAKAAFFGSLLEYYDFYIFASAAALVFPTCFRRLEEPAVAVAGHLRHFLRRTSGRCGVRRTLRRPGRAQEGDDVLPGAHGCRHLPDRLSAFFGNRGHGRTGAAGSPAYLSGHLRCRRAVRSRFPHPRALPAHRRGFFCSWTLTGTQAGFIVASLAFIPVAAMPDETLYSWGWRVPFWCSLLVLVVAYIVRRKLEEPDIFIANKEALTRPPRHFPSSTCSARTGVTYCGSCSAHSSPSSAPSSPYSASRTPPLRKSG